MENPRRGGAGVVRIKDIASVPDSLTPPPEQEQRLQSVKPTRKPRGGRRARDKGNRVERHLAAFLQSQGFAAERVPLSGSVRGRFSGDVSLPLFGRDYRVEVKARATGFRGLYAGLTGASLLIVKADRREPLVVLPLRLAIEIAKAVERRKGNAP
jgi:hypothetical protein